MTCLESVVVKSFSNSSLSMSYSVSNEESVMAFRIDLGILCWLFSDAFKLGGFVCLALALLLVLVG